MRVWGRGEGEVSSDSRLLQAPVAVEAGVGKCAPVFGRADECNRVFGLLRAGAGNRGELKWARRRISLGNGRGWIEAVVRQSNVFCARQLLCGASCFCFGFSAGKAVRYVLAGSTGSQLGVASLPANDVGGGGNAGRKKAKVVLYLCVAGINLIYYYFY